MPGTDLRSSLLEHWALANLPVLVGCWGGGWVRDMAKLLVDEFTTKIARLQELSGRLQKSFGG